ncbi:MAG: hypothetical protein EOO31_11160 [Comamonadaceae bacterium]|nr:MAG: hypothetical protein EOO31_11160 [Comamonadaceae bacterium]
MLSRTADHLFWMSRYTERAAKAALSGLSTKYSARAQHAWGFLPKEGAC